MTAKLLYPEYIDSKVQGVKLLIHHTPMLYNQCIKPRSLYTYFNTDDEKPFPVYCDMAAGGE